MRVILTLATLSGAITGSTALLPIVASDFLSVNSAEPIDTLDLVVEPQATLKTCFELKRGALGKKLGAITAIGTATQVRLNGLTVCRLADQHLKASTRI